MVPIAWTPLSISAWKRAATSSNASCSRPMTAYFIIYQRCCLTQTLSNIINPGEVGSTFMVELTAMAMYENNSSPELPDWPTTALCIHQPVNLSQSATDPDGDKLEYRFAAPYSGGGSALQPPSLYACDGAIPTPPCGPPYAECPFIEPEYSPQAPWQVIRLCRSIR
ncbi:MAG: hypothetical protein H6574_17485 [Lewinellaceae bacterium]|nr:hypothetical protein [Lewinellaceae bacterium]